MKTAVLITSFNRPDKTLKCIKAFFKCKKPEGHIFSIYVADASSDNKTINAIKSSYPKISIFNIEQNNYWSSGMNKAWKKAISYKKYDFFIFLNDDTILYRNAINVIFEDYVFDKNSLIVGVTEADNKLTYGGRKNNLKDKILSPNGKPQKIKYMNGNFVLIPYLAFEKLGFLNSKFSHSLGDLDYGIRALRNNVKLYITSKIIGHCKRNEFIWYDPNLRLSWTWLPKGRSLILALLKLA